MARPNHIPELDGLRGLAIALVMLYHLWRYSGPNPVGRAVTAVGNVGWIGVDIFFALSGFLIAGILLDSRGREDYFRRFYTSRALRIFPLYYVVVTAVTAAGFLNASFHWAIEHPALANPEASWAHYLYLTNFVIAWVGEDYVPIDIAWSLAIEEQFYLVAPLLVRKLSCRQLERVLLGVLAATPLLRLVTWLTFDSGYLPVHVLPFTRMDAIAAGCLAAVLMRRNVRMNLKIPVIALVMAAAATLPIQSRGDIFYVVAGYSLPALATAGLIYLFRVGDCGRLRAIISWPPLCVFGRLSFGLYLFHLPMRFAVDSLIDLGSGTLPEAVARVALISSLALAVAWVSYHCFELPVRTWGGVERPRLIRKRGFNSKERALALR